MTNYVISAITLDGDTNVYLNKRRIYNSSTIKWPFYEKVKIYDVKNILILEVVITGFYGYRRKISLKANNLLHNLNFEIISKNIVLTVDSDIIVFKKALKAFKYEGDFYINDIYVGSIRNKISFFSSELFYEFLHDKEINYYCVLLSLVLLRNEFNSGGH